MSDESALPDWEELQAHFAEHMRWAGLSVSLQEISDENRTLVRDLSNYDPAVAVPFLASLLTLPKYQSHGVRLEILAALAVMHCRGRKKANVAQAVRWFRQIGKSQCASAEDPAEDVFVALVHQKNGDYRLLEGLWESAGFYSQRVLDVIGTMPDTGEFGQIKKSVHALLVVSDTVCEKAGLHRYQLGSDEHHSALSPRTLPGRNSLISRVTITSAELDERGVSLDDLEPFIFHPWMRDELPEQQIGLSYLERCPLIVYGSTQVTVALPSAISVAVRDFVIASIVRGGLVESFDQVLAQNYSRLFFETPMLGGPIRAPVQWRKAGSHQFSYFGFEIDEGYYISFHLFLPSVQTHPDGGFKGIFEDKGALTNALQASIDKSISQFEERDDFRQGLVVLVGCGWGKGYATQTIELDRPHWRFESMSAADLVRLSWLGEMNPGYFWRIQDGLEAVEKAGVHIVNPNGILNLIGWVRSNNGHFVPHAQLPEGKITPEQPLMLNPPLNLLRDVRADSDRGYDRHRAVDNIGAWHDVQHVSSNPFFVSESSRRLYASMSEAQAGNLTAVYENSLSLWMSVDAPNTSEKEVVFRLWEMACEWLHRVGDALERHVETGEGARIFKVHVEFRDGDPPKEPGEKPTPEGLSQLCLVEYLSEQNACKAVFQPGFLAGFRIAENIAERLVARTLARAYLMLLGVKNCDDEAEALEVHVVPNNDARSFHFFHAQQFTDYVRDSLPKDLIAIDPVDDGSAKIGLGWRILEAGQGNKIEGRSACTGFLEKVVDVLVSEIIDDLKQFDRLLTLTRLIVNCEKATTEDEHWSRTSAAVLGLHGDKPSTVTRYVEQRSKFAGASIASRISIEIALCVCPTNGGKSPSDIELSKLIARTALLIRIGGLSDAIYYNALAPELNISPLGDILFRDDFGHLVVEPMLARVIGDKFVTDAPLQRRNYEDPGIVPATKGNISDEFWEVWNSEMDFNLDEAIGIISALEDKGIQDHTAVFTIKQSEYLDLVCSEQVSEDVASSFLRQFSLITRPNWAEPPGGFSLKDIYPWRFGRRLSFVVRPILEVDDGADPLLVIAPGVLRKGFVYLVDGAYSGRLEQSFFRTEGMRDIWWGKAREGHTFNAKVVEELTKAGWQVRANIELPEILNRKLDRDFGDVDALAWRSDRKEVLVIECKDLSLARNYSELAALLSDYQGVEVEGEADRLKRHLDRVVFLRENLDQVQRFTGVQPPEIISCLACSGVVPMQYAKIDALSTTHVGGIPDILRL